MSLDLLTTIQSGADWVADRTGGAGRVLGGVAGGLSGGLLLGGAGAVEAGPIGGPVGAAVGGYYGYKAGSYVGETLGDWAGDAIHAIAHPVDTANVASGMLRSASDQIHQTWSTLVSG